MSACYFLFVFHKYLKPNIFSVKSLISLFTFISSSFSFPNKYTITLCSVAFGKNLEFSLALPSSLWFTYNYLPSPGGSVYKIYFIVPISTIDMFYLNFCTSLIIAFIDSIYTFLCSILYLATHKNQG